MHRIAQCCEKIGGRKRPDKRAPARTDYGTVAGQIGAAEIETRQAEIESTLTGVERALCDQEKETKLYKLSYLRFIYAVKRYTFRGQPFNERIFEGICPDLYINWKDIKEEKDQDLYYWTFKNSILYHEGKWNLDRLMALGFLTCAHNSSEAQCNEFWMLLNPEIEETVSV